MALQDNGWVNSKVHTCVWGADEALTAPGRHFFSASIDVVSHSTGLDVSLAGSLHRTTQSLHMPAFCRVVVVATSHSDR